MTLEADLSEQLQVGPEFAGLAHVVGVGGECEFDAGVQTELEEGVRRFIGVEVDFGGDAGLFEQGDQGSEKVLGRGEVAAAKNAPGMGQDAHAAVEELLGGGHELLAEAVIVGLGIGAFGDGMDGADDKGGAVAVLGADEESAGGTDFDFEADRVGWHASFIEHGEVLFGTGAAGRNRSVSGQIDIVFSKALGQADVVGVLGKGHAAEPEGLGQLQDGGGVHVLVAVGQGSMDVAVDEQGVLR